MANEPLIAAVVALAALLGYILKQLFNTALNEKRAITQAYMENVQASTAAITQSTEATRQLTEAIAAMTRELQEHAARTADEHRALCELLKQRGQRK